MKVYFKNVTAHESFDTYNTRTADADGVGSNARVQIKDIKVVVIL